MHRKTGGDDAAQLAKLGYKQVQRRGARDSGPGPCCERALAASGGCWSLSEAAIPRALAAASRPDRQPAGRAWAAWAGMAPSLSSSAGGRPCTAALWPAAQPCMRRTCAHMRTHAHMPPTHPTHTHPIHTQELVRHLNTFRNFAICFSFLSPITGLTG